MMDENATDRSNEAAVLDRVRQHLYCMPVGNFDIRQTPTGAPMDGQVYVDGMYVGLVEVKSINYSVDQLMRTTESFYVEVNDLKKLKALSYVEGHGWTKRVSFAYMTLKDGRIHMISLNKISDCWDQVSAGKNATDNHGQEETSRKAVLVPIELWEEIT